VPFYAHSSPDREQPRPEGWQVLRDHLRRVAKSAAQFTADIRLRVRGALHDLGKYRKKPPLC
jgi:hypothetical protein